MSRIKEAIGYEWAWPNVWQTSVNEDAAQQQIEYDQQTKESINAETCSSVCQSTNRIQPRAEIQDQPPF